MTQADLNRVVAAATGETVDLISRQGFEFIEVPAIDRDPMIWDWDDADARLLGTTFD
jgi:uroporphyrinogen-III synthase